MNNVETANSSRLVDALAMLASSIRSSSSNTPVPDAVSGPINNPEQVVLDAAQRLIGLRSGFTIEDFTKALEQRFQPSEDEEGTTVYEFVPASPMALVERRPVMAASKPDEVECQFISTAQALVPQIEASLTDLANTAEEHLDQDISELRKTLSINLDSYTAGGIARPDSDVLINALRKGVDQMGEDLGITSTTAAGSTYINVYPQNREMAAKYLLLRATMQSVIGAGAALTELRKNDVHRVFTQIECSFRSVTEIINSLYATARIFGSFDISEQTGIPGVFISSGQDGSTSLYEILSALSVLASSDAIKLLESGGLDGARSVADRVAFFEKELAKVHTQTFVLSQMDTLGRDLLTTKIADLASQLKSISTLLSRVVQNQPQTVRQRRSRSIVFEAEKPMESE